MFDVIVVGTDGSDTASVAVMKALEIARNGAATLHVVHVQRLVSVAQLASSSPIGTPNFDIHEVNRSIEAKGRDVLQHVVDQAERAGVKCETYLREGDAAQALLEVAEQVGADLLVVGNRGMSGVRRMLGSVPNKVSHHCPCSLLIVDTAAH